MRLDASQAASAAVVNPHPSQLYRDFIDLT
jgi:hypothetical protein